MLETENFRNEFFSMGGGMKISNFFTNLVFFRHIVSKELLVAQATFQSRSFQSGKIFTRKREINRREMTKLPEKI